MKHNKKPHRTAGLFMKLKLDRGIIPMILSKSKKLLATGASKCDNERTTHKAVKPNRHSLAIFTPTYSTGVNASLLSTDNVLTVYGGLIVQNTIPFLGNMYSRLYAVVETCQPLFLGLVTLTKHKGASIMTAFLTGILAKLSHFTPAESRVLGFIIGLPMACLVVGILFAMGV